MITEAVLQLLLLPNFALKIGFMLMSAMFIGAIVLENWKNLRIVAFTLMIFVAYQAWIHESILSSTNTVELVDKNLATMLNIILSLVIIILWYMGMALGIWIVSKTKKPYLSERHVLEAELEEIVKRQTFKELQDFIASGSKEPTKPLKPLEENGRER
jgi:hypothetical protein